MKKAKREIFLQWILIVLILKNLFFEKFNMEETVDWLYFEHKNIYTHIELFSAFDIQSSVINFFLY